MTSTYWHQSETLINDILPIIFLISGFLLFILVGVWLSHSNKKVGIGILTIIGLNLFIFSATMIYSKDFRKLTSHITSKNRDYEVTTLNKTNFSNQRMSGYSIEDIETTSKLPFYTKENSIDTSNWQYLGKDEHLYFLEKESIIYNVPINKEIVTFKPNLEKEVIINESYATINDKSFVTLGFKQQVGPAITHIEITDKLKDQTFNNHNLTVKLIQY